MALAPTTILAKQMAFATRRADLQREALRVLSQAQVTADQLAALVVETDADLASADAVLTEADRAELIAAASEFKTRIESEVIGRLDAALAPRA